MRVFSVRESLFKTEPLFIVGCSHEELDRYLRRKYRQNAGDNIGQTGQMFTFKRPPWRVVWSRKPQLPVILHETFHLVTRICQDAGVPIRAHHDNGDIGDEAAAYMFEFFASAILKRLRHI